jgi:fructose/tagatose bisphosphate aldolase
MENKLFQEFETMLEGSVEIKENQVKVKDAAKLRINAHKLAEASALNTDARQGYARYLTRLVCLELGIYPASINDLYAARGKGKVPFTFSVPAINLRVLSFDCARAAFRVMQKMDGAAVIFEIARSEMGYTDQKPSEYATSILTAAIAEGYKGPVFIQGDHFQVSAKKYATNGDAEITALKSLIDEAIAAGFFNIDVDTSTLVEIDKPTIAEQQLINTKLSAALTDYIRSKEPAGVCISVGGEIGEVGGHNSTEEELRGYLDGFAAELKKLGPKAYGLSKISIQTGTSHGGVVLPDGSIAKVNVDFNILRDLSRVARKDYGLGGTVQHGASTLPEDAFSKFVEYEATEVHLATNFTNMFFDLIPADFKKKIYAYLDEKSASDRKPEMTDEQFYYKVRKNAIGPFKAESWRLPHTDREKIGKAWEDQFTKLFTSLGVRGTAKTVAEFIKPVMIKPDIKNYLAGGVEMADVSDLAD